MTIMRLLCNARTRAGLLVVCLGLIGGTGCITMAVVSSLQEASIRRANEERYKATVESYKLAAAKGDLAGITLLGLEYLRDNAVTGRDISKGMALLEQAVAKQYGPAEYALGLILLKNSRINSFNPPIQMDSARGMELLKRAASHACWYSMPSTVVDLGSPANTIQYLYRSGTLVPKDLTQANLWFARAIIHCQGNNGYGIRNMFLPTSGATAQDHTETLAWLQLLPSDTDKDNVPRLLTMADHAAVERRATQLRQAVTESERQYPAPSQKQFIVEIGQPS